MGIFPSDPHRLGAANRDPEEEALGWVVRLTSGQTTATDERAFAAWHKDAENALAYERARRLWMRLGPIVEKQEAAGWPDAEADPLVPTFPTRRSRYITAYAALAACLLIACFVQYIRVWQYDHVTGSSVSGNIALIDGSQVTMGPGSAFSSNFANGERHVSLARGEAYFDVRHDPAHPFVVSAGNGEVRVLGTAFTVRRQNNGVVTVTVARGRVQVTSGAKSAVLAPDRQISFGSDGLGSVKAVDASISMAWTRGRLVMENRSVGDVLAELNRYDSGTIVLLNREAAQRRINAVIDLQRTDDWLSALASSQHLLLTHVGPVIVLR